VKTLKLAIVISLLVIFASVSIVSAASTMEGTAIGYWSTAEPSPGSRVTLTVNFQSSSSQTLYIYAIGVHGDWMEDGRFYGPDLSDDPEVVETGGLCVKEITLDIPASASLGSHSYYIGIDGMNEDGDTFSWDSSGHSVTFAVSSNPTPTNSGSSGDPSNTGSTGGFSNILVYVAVIAVVAVVAILIAVLLVKKSGKKHAEPVESSTPEPTFVPPPQSPKPEQKPDTETEPETESEEPTQKPDEKDFTI
jgi:flagellar basal body-associated protein FliL